MAEVPARFLRSEHHVVLTPGSREPGDFRFMDASYHACHPPAPGQECWLEHACPRNGGNCGMIWIGNGHKPEQTPQHKWTWQWNGDVASPTLTPSINCLARGPDGEEYSGCGWHGYLTDGIWRD